MQVCPAADAKRNTPNLSSSLLTFRARGFAGAMHIALLFSVSRGVVLWWRVEWPKGKTWKISFEDIVSAPSRRLKIAISSDIVPVTRWTALLLFLWGWFECLARIKSRQAVVDKTTSGWISRSIHRILPWYRPVRSQIPSCLCGERDSIRMRLPGCPLTWGSLVFFRLPYPFNYLSSYTWQSVRLRLRVWPD